MSENEIKVKKKCFIVTPIGGTSDPIFRHINGVIDECIEPILKNKYEIIVAHRINKPGSIYKQIIKEIFEADLVIANLTNTNPNVMYELAFRHAINKPVIMIMEKGDYNLPFDVISERTIFYDNDFQGAIELKKQLGNMLESIEKESEEGFSPIYDVLKSIGEINYVKNKINSIKPEEKTELQYILDRLEKIDGKVSNGIKLDTTNLGIEKNGIEYTLILNENIKKDEMISKSRNDLEHSLINCEYYNKVIEYGFHGRWFRITIRSDMEDLNKFRGLLESIPNWEIKIVKEV